MGFFFKNFSRLSSRPGAAAGALAACGLLLLGGCSFTALSDELLTGGDAAVSVDAGSDAAVADAAAVDGVASDLASPADSAGTDSARADTASAVDAGTTVDCNSPPTLETLVACVLERLPDVSAPVYSPPSAAQFGALRQAAGEMLNGSCASAVPSALQSIVRRYSFDDADTGRRYCVLEEVLDGNGDDVLDHGWGLLVVDASADRDLHHQAPRPLLDTGTELQAATLFKQTRSRSFAMAGAHPAATATASACQAGQSAAEATRNADSMLQALTEAIQTHHGADPYVVLQWLGLPAGACNVDVQLSYGVAARPPNGSELAALRTELATANPSWRLGTPGPGACNLDEASNTQGRLLNDVAAGQVCTVAASAASEHYIAVLQQSGFRRAADWLSALQAVWP